MKKKIFSKTIYLLLLLLVPILFFRVLAAPPDSKYLPGETLDPNCSPGDSNCDVGLTTGSILFANSSFLFSQDNSNLYWDDSNNYLGIGTNSPSSTLDVSGNANISGDLTVDTNTFYLDSSTHRIGIGTTTPSAKLHIVGGINVTGTTTFNGISYSWPSSDGTSGQVLTTDGSGTLSWTSTTGGISGSGSAGQVVFWTDSDTISGNNDFYWDNTNNRLGIGTTTPPYKLTVSGDLYVSATSTLGSTTSTPTILTGYIQSDIIPYSDLTYNLGSSSFRWANLYVGTTTIGSTITIGSHTFEGSATTTLFTTGNSNQLVLGANGNVGIGTIIPSQELEVSGDIRISGKLYDSGTTYYIDPAGGASYFAGDIYMTDDRFIGIAGDATERIQFDSNEDDIEILYGDVGIRTTTPAYTLDVNGTFGVSGTTTLATTIFNNLTNGFLKVDVNGKVSTSTIDISDNTNLTVSATGLELSGDSIALTSGYTIPLSASTTNWESFYQTPSSRITAGTGLSWSSNTLNWSSSGLTWQGNIIGAAYGGTGQDTSGWTGFVKITGGTWGTSTIDISDDTNLTAGDHLTLSGDTLNVDDDFLLNTGDTATGDYTFDSGTLFIDSVNDRVGIGTTTPEVALHVGTSSPASITESSGSLFVSKDLEVGETAYLGPMEFSENSGVVSWIDMPVTSSASAGTQESYIARIDGINILTVYSESDGAGSIQNYAVGIATSTPEALLGIGVVSGRDYLIVGDTASPEFIIKNTGLVGIGTTSPTEKLTITLDDSSTSTVSTLLGLNKTTTGTAGAGIGAGLMFRAEADDSSLVDLAKITSTFDNASSTSPNTSLHFYTRGGGSLTEAVTIDESGNVGIGTINPQNQLHIKSATGVNSVLAIDTTDTDNTTSDAELAFYEAGVKKWRIYSDGDSDVGVSTRLRIADSTKDLITFEAFSDGLTVVGIGTNNPADSAQLHLYSAGAGSENLRIENAATTADVGIHFKLTGSQDFIIGLDDDDGDKFKISDSTVLGTNDRLVIDSSGLVGIGTTTPAYTLQVWGSAGFGSATSTTVNFTGYISSDFIPSADNTYSLGSSSYRWANLYAATTSVGDLLFGNEFRITESTSTLQSLIFKNQKGEKIMELDENGNLSIAGELEIKEQSLSEIVKQILSDIGLTIENGIAKVKEIITEKITTKQICLEDENGKICLDKEGLRQLIEKAKISSTPVPETKMFCYDADKDGFGNPGGPCLTATEKPLGYADNDDDCNDNNKDVHPGASEICEDGIDNDCDGKVDSQDEDCSVDLSTPTPTPEPTPEPTPTPEPSPTPTPTPTPTPSPTPTPTPSPTPEPTPTPTLTPTPTPSPSPSPEPTPTPTPIPTCDENNLDLCNNETDCLGVNGYWYDNSCHSEPQATCGISHLELCDSQEKCEAVGLYWYNDSCHLEEESNDLSDNGTNLDSSSSSSTQQ